MPRQDITDGEIHETESFAERARTYFTWPGIVVRFYPGVAGLSAPSADIQPAVHDVRFCVEDGVPEQPSGTPQLVDGQRYSEPWPVIPKVPIRFPSGGGMSIWWDLKPGDEVELQAWDLDPSTFQTTGQPSDPPFTRRNSGTHWVATPGKTADPGCLGPAGGLLCIGSTSGPSVTVGPSGVNLGAPVGSPPVDAVGLSSRIDLFIQTVMTWVPVPNDGGAALKTALTAAGFTPASTTASKTVKCAP